VLVQLENDDTSVILTPADPGLVTGEKVRIVDGGPSDRESSWNVWPKSSIRKQSSVKLPIRRVSLRVDGLVRNARCTKL
jgi:hypothetical protein